MRFEWDPAKAQANQRRHGVSFHEAASVLEDHLSATFPDKTHSEGEARFVTIGASKRGQLLVVAHTERAGAIRIINARRATRREREFYEQG
ncbi:MAG TPA: BrnT family toxin [Candidatus Polarisedimenticolia bacterium]|nr:BrnT family toxin [Candidatus Polarisedimenticolia bacterium]